MSVRDDLIRDGWIRDADVWPLTSDPAPREASRAWVRVDGGTVVADVGGSTHLLTRTFDPHEYGGKMRLTGRFVGADLPNRNGAVWSAADLEMSLPTVPFGPLNWMHEERHIVGAITGARYVHGSDLETAALSQPHIEADAAVWDWIYPQEAQVIQMASDTGRLWYSMECVSEQVECGGCGERFSYMAAQQAGDDVCDHIRAKSDSRRFVNPVFMGGAVIIPPARPGWADADARVVQQAREIAASSDRPDGVDAGTWQALMEMLLVGAR